MPVEERSLRSRLLSGSVFVLASRGITTATSLGSQALLARILKVDDYGRFLLVSSLVALAGSLSSLGLRPTLVREISRAQAQGRPGEARRVVLLGLAWGCVGSLVAALILKSGLGLSIAEHVWKEAALAALMGLVGLWIFGVVLQSLVSESFRGFQDFHRASLYGGPLSGLLLLACLFPAWRNSVPLELRFAVSLAAATMLLSSLFPLPFLGAKLSRLRGPSKIGSAFLLNQAWPALIAQFAALLLGYADLWCLGASRPKTEVALYGSAQKLAGLVSSSMMIVGGVLPPIIAELHAKGEKARLQSALRRVAGITGALSLAAYAVFFFGGADILGLLWGPSYSPASVSLAILGLGQLANVLTGSCGYTLLMTGHQRAFMNFTLVLGTASILSMAALAPAYGAAGLAPVAASGTALLNILLWLYVRKKVGVWTHANWLPPYAGQAPVHPKVSVPRIGS